MTITKAWFLWLCVFVFSSSSSTAVVPTPISLDTVVTDSLPDLHQSSSKCYNLTFPESTVQTVIWWDLPKLLVRLDPCLGVPHLKVSIYDCPGNGGRVVYEFMGPIMVNDAQVQGKTLPKYWEWPGDVESLAVDITHQTYYIEITNFQHSGIHFRKPTVVPSYTLVAKVFEGQNQTKEELFPLKNLNKGIWNKKVSQATPAQGAAFTKSETRDVVVEWYMPGNSATVQLNSSSPERYEWQLYWTEVTDMVGDSSGTGLLAKAALPSGGKYCPVSGDECTTDNCQSCKSSYELCPRDFLTDCSESTFNVPKMRKNLKQYENNTFSESAGGTKIPFDAFLKDPNQYTAWTVCGIKKTLNWIGADKTIAVQNAQKRAETGKWFQNGELQTAGALGNMRAITLSGFKEDRNNVYLINVVVHDKVTNEYAVHEMMTLQLRTPRYEPPKMSSTDMGMIIGVSTTVGVCILAFAGVAIHTKRKRIRKLKQRIRLKM